MVNIATDTPYSRISGWREKLATNKNYLEVFSRGNEELVEMVNFCPEDRYVVHNDLLHFNLIVRDNKVVALIDWGCALYGDFLYDLAMFTTWQFYYPSLTGIDFTGEAKKYFGEKGVDVEHFDERMRCYQLHLLLDSLAYNAFKENWKNAEMVVKRLNEVINNHD